MSSKILIVGDLHGNYTGLASLLKKDKFLLAFQLGDLGLYTDFKAAHADKKAWSHNEAEMAKFINDYQNGNIEALPCPVYYIKGNHDDYDNGKALEVLNLFSINNRSLHVAGNGITVAGFGGIYSPVKFKWGVEKLKGRNKRFYTEDELVDFINKFQDEPIDVLITHEAAVGFMPNREEGKEKLRYLVNCIEPKYYLHGHHHYAYETSWGEMSIIGIGNFGVNSDAYRIIEF